MPDYSDPKVEEVSKMAAQAILNAKSSEVGSDVFDAIEATDLTDEQRQQVYCNLAEIIATDACKGLTADTANTIMRGNTAGTQFMTRFTEKYAAEYVAAVEYESLNGISNLELPKQGYTSSHQDPNVENSPLTGNFDPTLRPDNVPQAGFRSSPPGDTINRRDMPPELVSQWDEVYEQGANVIVGATMSQLPKLSPEARNFYQASGAAVQAALPGEAGEKAAVMVMVNNIGLRGATNHVKLDAASVKKNQKSNEEAILAEVMEQSNNVAQSHFNLLPLESVSEASKPQNKIVNKVRQKELDRSRNVFANLAKGNVPDTAPDKLAPNNAPDQLNAQIPGRAERFGQSGQGQGQGQKSRFASVRDSLASGASRLKNAVGNKLENKGKEQKLGDVAPEKVELYKSMQEALKEMERLEGEAAIGAAMGSRQGTKDFQNPQIPNTIENLKAEIASMEKNDPGLKQLGRGKVGQVVHSKIRDAAKAVGSKLKA